jgi:hypothetical protein
MPAERRSASAKKVEITVPAGEPLSRFPLTRIVGDALEFARSPR